MREALQALAFENSAQLLQKAEEWLNCKYGANFAAEHPEAVVELAKVYALCYLAQVVGHQTIQLQGYEQ